MHRSGPTRPASCAGAERLRPSLLARLFVVAWLVVMLPARGSADDDGNTAQQQVFAAERSFAKSMADRSLEDFGRFVADEAIFFGAKEVQRGKAEVIGAWSRFFEGEQAPFSWEPDQVEVLSSGELALSTGLVKDPAGKIIGRFNSIWRLEAPGTWRVIFDKGSPPGPDDRP
ncbi:MAG TPA: nuclear transport factor 2 family protein [Steroidobacteraceae bacterium]|nr:nuclear transport factor 2 family protein [Steroidobacteraceae bacterium]